MCKRNKVKLLFMVFFVAFLGMICSGCGKNQTKKEESAENLPKIIVGCDMYPPYSYEDANGEPIGIDVYLAREAFRRMGYDAEIQFINWEDKKELVESGAIDCIWCSFTIDGREDQYRWAKPYMKSRQVVAVRVDSDIYTLADLEGKKIAVQSTTKPEEILLSHADARIPELAEVFSLQNRELLYPFLSKGYVDAIAAHETSILQCMKDYGLEYRILDEPLLTVGLGVAFAKNDDRGLETELTGVLQEMQEDGTLEEIIGNYLDDPQRYLWEEENED